jgi:hypothetical protein
MIYVYVSNNIKGNTIKKKGALSDINSIDVEIILKLILKFKITFKIYEKS